MKQYIFKVTFADGHSVKRSAIEETKEKAAKIIKDYYSLYAIDLRCLTAWKPKAVQA